MPDQPGLFDLPDRDEPTRPDRSAPGRKRETWAWTVTARVTVLDAEVVRRAAEEDEAHAVSIPLDAAPDTDSELAMTPDIFDILVSMVWPTDGLYDLEEAGAFRIREVDVEVAPESDDMCTLCWTVTVILDDVPAIRRVATRARPDQVEAIRRSFAVAWENAVDPFAPLREIPGISWRPGDVAIEHRPRRESRGRDAAH